MQLGIDGADAIEGALYTRLEIGVETNRIVVLGTTGFGEEAPIHIGGDAAEAFERLGLDGYLRRRKPGGKAIRAHADAMRRKVTAYTPIYVESDGRMTHWDGARA